MELSYTYSSWRERILPSRESKVLFVGRGVLKGEGDLVQVFEAPIRPFYVAVWGEWVKGYLVEEGQLVRFMLRVRDKGEGDRLKVRMVVRGVYLGGFDGKVYRVMVNWPGRHLHVIGVPRGYRVAEVRPRGYSLRTSAGWSELTWSWPRGFAGELRFTLIKI